MYLVTVCTHDRAPILGTIVDGHVQLTAAGEHARYCWSAIPEHFAHVSLDEFVIMPDHVHGIVRMDAAPKRATHASPLPAGSLMTPAEAAECAGAFKPKVVYPYHYQGQDPQTFADALKGAGVEVRVRDWYAGNK